ncbi:MULTISPECIES: hypothetical protein [Nonomuraea]|uniref:Uncharacterized protein n=2 Tax=Nonomuraea TaxID=83681 RepID=A0A7W5VP49_9ACTN|nr:hypothetical protein [Nonomuraea dietziae]MBB3731687.1 hypothetical protein [Nonomuraea dietziae]
MSIFRRLPSDVRKGLATSRGERVLTFAEAADGYVVATDQALFLPDGTRVPWEQVEQAGWDDEGLRLTTSEGRRLSARVASPHRLPEAVRERVNSTIVVNKYVELPGRGGVRLVARRAPGADTFTWSFHFDEGLDPEDPGLRAQAEQALEGLRRSMGV